MRPCGSIRSPSRWPRRGRADPRRPGRTDAEANDDSQPSLQGVAVNERARLRKERERRDVWVVDADLLRAVEINTGLTDGEYTEVLKGSLQPGDDVVTGIRSPDRAASPTAQAKTK